MKKNTLFILLLIYAVNICCAKGIITNDAGNIKRNIEGHYANDWEITKTATELILTKDGNGYKYKMITPKRSLEGKVGASVNPDCFTLNGIRWASWKIDGISQELPEDVTVYIEEDGLSIQNYGESSMGNNSYIIFDDIKEKYIFLKEKYVTLPNGTMVEKWITEDAVDMIFKRFEAIENGDIAAFRSTLGEIQDGVDFHYQLGIIYKFFGDFFGIDSDDFDDAVATGEGLTEIANTLFYGEHPLRSRNTGLLIKKLEVVNGLGLVVVATNNKNEEIIYNFLYW